MGGWRYRLTRWLVLVGCCVVQRRASGALPLFVGVFADCSPAEMNSTAEAVGLDLVQLHGNEPAGIVAQLIRPAIRVVHVIPNQTTAEECIQRCQQAGRSLTHSLLTRPHRTTHRLLFPAMLNHLTQPLFSCHAVSCRCVSRVSGCGCRAVGYEAERRLEWRLRSDIRLVDRRRRVRSLPRPAGRRVDTFQRSQRRRSRPPAGSGRVQRSGERRRLAGQGGGEGQSVRQRGQERALTSHQPASERGDTRAR